MHRGSCAVCITRRSRGAFLLLLFAGLCGSGLAQAQTPTPDLNALPENCINGGTELQTACSEILTAAQTYFNVAPGADAASGAAANITQEQIDAYVAQAPAPTKECCASACGFNADFCSCDQGVLDFAVQLTANNANAYKSIALAFAQACQYKLFYGPTCPPKDQQAPAVTENKKVCAALPEPIPASQAAPAAGGAAPGNATAPAAGNATVPAGAAADGTTPANATSNGTMPGALPAAAAAAVGEAPAMPAANLTDNSTTAGSTTAKASEPSAVASGGGPVR